MITKEIYPKETSRVALPRGCTLAAGEGLYVLYGFPDSGIGSEVADRRTCVDCRAVLPAGAHGNCKRCPDCRARVGRQNSPAKECSVSECDRFVRARGLCGTHYNQQYQPGRHAKVQRFCTYCGAACMKQKSNTRSRKAFCSLTCRDLYRIEHPVAQRRKPKEKQ